MTQNFEHSLTYKQAAEPSLMDSKVRLAMLGHIFKEKSLCDTLPYPHVTNQFLLCALEN